LNGDLNGDLTPDPLRGTDEMPGSVPLRSDVFAANRARGRVAFTVTTGPGGSRRGRVHESGALRVRFPNGNRHAALDAVLVNTAGGMAGGDRFAIDIDVDAGAQLTVTTAAAEKIYRSLGPDTDVVVKLAVGPGGALKWLPQETILFDRIRLRRTTDVTLAGDARLLLAEAAVFGRSAMGEAVTEGLFLDRRRIRVDGTLVLAECNRLDGEIAERLARRAVAKGGVGVASVIKWPGSETDAEAVRAVQDDFFGEVGVSAWNGLAAARLVAPDGAALRRDLAAVLTALDAGPLPRLWLN
jgi:urease accessory protein